MIFFHSLPDILAMRAGAEDLFVKLALKTIFIIISDYTFVFLMNCKNKITPENKLFFNVFSKWYFFLNLKIYYSGILSRGGGFKAFLKNMGIY